MITAPADAVAAARASEALGWRAALGSHGPNRLVSPSSLAMSLAVAAEGARGASRESVDAALGLGGAHRAAAFGALREALRRYESSPETLDPDDPPADPVVHQATRIATLEHPILPAFLDRVVTYPGSSVVQLDRGGAEADLSAWVHRVTAGLIESSSVRLSPDDALVMQDAVLFGARWERPFRGGPRPLVFRAPGGRRHLEGIGQTMPVAHAAAAGWEAVRLRYDDALAADVIVPTRDIHALGPAELWEAGRALDASAPEMVDLTMPTLKLTARTDLLAALPGVDLSDLSGIFSGARATGWTQQARLNVGARGTVGAAVTEMVVSRAAFRPPPARTFVVDRPYVLRVLDTRTGWAVFLAVVTDPSLG